MSFLRPVVSYKLFNDIVRFVRTYWSRRQKLYPGYFFVNPILNQSFKWQLLTMVNLDNEKIRDMDNLLDRFFEELEARLKLKFPRYIIKVSQLNGSSFVLVKRLRGKILNDNKLFLYDTVQRLSEDSYKKYADNCNKFSHNYFRILNL